MSNRPIPDPVEATIRDLCTAVYADERLRQGVLDNAPSAVPDRSSKADDWALKLGSGSIGTDPPKRTATDPWGHRHWAPAPGMSSASPMSKIVDMGNVKDSQQIVNYL